MKEIGVTMRNEKDCTMKAEREVDVPEALKNTETREREDVLHPVLDLVAQVQVLFLGQN